jgi:hypothetical protein
MLRTSPELVLREVDVTIEANVHSVGPHKSWIADEGVEETSSRVEVCDRVVLDVAGVDVTVGVGVHAVLQAGFAVVSHSAASFELGVARAVKESFGWDGEQLTSAGCGVEELGVVG